MTVVCGLFAPALVAVSAAAAAPGEIDGTVVESHSRWGYGGNLIVTEAVVEQADGSRVTLHELGGRVGDIATVVSHSPPLLEPGSTVRVQVKEATAATGRRWLRVTRVLEEESASLPPGSVGFVRTINDNAVPLFFTPSCAVLVANSEGAETVPGDLEFDAIQRSVDTWNQALSTCSRFFIDYLGPEPLEPAFDGINVIRFREDRWCRPASGDDPEICHDPGAAGLTFVTFGLTGDRDGEILDADIEINGVDFALTVDGQGTGSAGCDSDIANTLTHELGHLLGLDHTCYEGEGPRPFTSDGEPAPSCFPESQLSAEVRNATMYNFQECGEVKKAVLEQDDIDGACSIYAGVEPSDCTYPSFGGGFVEKGGCSASGNGAGGDGLLALLALTALACIRSRRP